MSVYETVFSIYIRAILMMSMLLDYENAIMKPFFNENYNEVNFK